MWVSKGNSAARVVKSKVTYVVREKLSQSILSFTQAALFAKVSGGTTRDLQALPGHLWALAAVNNLSRTDPGFSKPWPDWPLGNTE